MHILITGGSGFIGSHLAHAITQQGHRVTVAARNPTPNRYTHPDIQTLQIDFCKALQPEDWFVHLEGVDVVINAVGIIRETGHPPLQALPEPAPIALFHAAIHLRLPRVLHLAAVRA
ncbi:MAG: NAD-dependent epimerase/dehydratase family protein, partial [Gammaproteobacteria bacterium]|nr:NAD-dependent epimerase/dehydratase family protein [Gammaproteobacteria bacterium]